MTELKNLLESIDNIGATEIAKFACNGDPSNKHEFEVIELLEAYAVSLEKMDKAKASLNRAHGLSQDDDSDSPSIYQKLMSLQLHEHLKIDESYSVLRVIGGWIYKAYDTVGEDYQGNTCAVFVHELKGLTIQEQMDKPSFKLIPAWSENEYILASDLWRIFKKNPGTNGKKMAIDLLRARQPKESKH